MSAPPPSHDRLTVRYSLTAELVAESALAVGAGAATSSAATASDLPVARDGAGRPYVPGSSLRGAWRAALESLLRGLDRPEVRVCDPFDADEASPLRSCGARVQAERDKALAEAGEISEPRAFDLAWQGSCEICRLFGHLFLASRVRVADLSLLAGTEPYERDGVGLDRDLKTAAKGVLYNFEALPAGSRFRLRIDVENADDSEIGLLLLGLGLFGDGFARLGGKGARGLGLVRIEGLTAERRTAADFFTGGRSALAAADLATFEEAARRRFVGESD